MIKLLFSAIAGITITSTLFWVGDAYPVLELWNLLPGIILAFIIPGVHGPFREAAYLYNAVFFSLLIYTSWWLISKIRQTSA